MSVPSRYVVAALLDRRGRFWQRAQRWSLPIEWLPMVTATQLRAVVQIGRPLSAVVVDATLPGADAELVADIGARCILLVGGSAVSPHITRLPVDSDPAEVLRALAARAVPIPDLRATHDDPLGRAGRGGRVVAVTGPEPRPRSAVTIRVAEAMVAAGDRVVVVDAGPWPDIGRALGWKADRAGLVEAGRAVGRGPVSPETVEAALGSTGLGFSVLTGDHSDVISSRVLGAVVTGLRHNHDVVLVVADARLCPGADAIVVVDGPGRNDALADTLGAPSDTPLISADPATSASVIVHRLRLIGPPPHRPVRPGELGHWSS